MKQKEALEHARKEYLALTFNDVRLRPAHSKYHPDDVNLDSKFSRNVSLKIPIVSAAMDKVTEYPMAIKLAELGGLGIIHRGLSIEDQAFHVERVKHYVNGMVENPITLQENQSVEEVLRMKEEKGYMFNSFPVLNNTGSLVGIVTGSDFEFNEDATAEIKDIMSHDVMWAEEGTTLNEAYETMIRKKKKILPIKDEKGAVVAMYTFKDTKRIRTGIGDMNNIDGRGRLRVGAAIGTGEEGFERAKKLYGAGVDVVVIDTAHGDTEDAINTLTRLKKDYDGKMDIVVGNVSIGTSAKSLADYGADGIRVGQGPGSICTTRMVTGIGRPQVSAVYDCVRAIGSSIPICADGGLENSGDIPIAIAAGAHSVMMGSMLAGTNEAPGEIISYDGQQWKAYRGMGSIGAMRENSSSRERYFQESRDEKKLISEGIEGLVAYKGSLEEVITQYVGGLRGGMGYVGAENIEELREKGQFDRITGNGIAESHPHGIHITKDEPNYRR